MIHEKIITRESGKQIKIVVDFVVTTLYRTYIPKYTTKQFWRGKGAKKWNDSPTIGIGIFDLEKSASEKEIEQAKLELWKKLKPTN